MRILACITLLFGMQLASMSAYAAASADFQFANTGTDQGNLPYRYFVPSGYSATQSYPLILFLHGSGERGNNNTDQLNNSANGAMRLLDNGNLAVQPVFMVAPQCPANGDWSGATLTAALTAVDQIVAQYNIDPDRIYITGLSMGGYGTWRAVAQRPDFFAAAVPMSGGGSTSQVDSVSAIPFWFFHAQNDPTVNVNGSINLVNALRSAGARVIFTHYDTGGHGIWPKGYITPLLFDWLVSQQRGVRNENTPPSVHIAQPTEASIFFTPSQSAVLSGVAANGSDSIDQVQWDVLGGSSGNTTGGTAWNTGSIELAQGENLIRVTATGPSYYSGYGGDTTFNDLLRVMRSQDVIFADGLDKR